MHDRIKPAVKFTCPVMNHVPVKVLKGLSHEKDFKKFDKNLQNLAYLRDAAGF